MQRFNNGLIMSGFSNLAEKANIKARSQCFLFTVGFREGQRKFSVFLPPDWPFI